MDTFALNVEQLFIYPIKACAGVPVPSMNLQGNGFIHNDRRWAIVNEGNCVEWQGAHPRLALIQPHLSPTELSLTRLDDPNAGSVSTPVTSGDIETIFIWNEETETNDAFDAWVAEPSVNAFISETVSAPLRLVRLSDEAVSRSNANPIHLLTRESVQQLEDLPEAEAKIIRRLRPNVVLSGFPKEHALKEDALSALHWHQGEITVHNLCVRCVVPNVDPDTGVSENVTLKAVGRISRARRGRGAIFFGIYGRSQMDATLTVGDALSGLCHTEQTAPET